MSVSFEFMTNKKWRKYYSQLTPRIFACFRFRLIWRVVAERKRQRLEPEKCGPDKGNAAIGHVIA